VTFRTIADTYCRDNRVWDEWLIRDNAAIAVQLGQTAKSAAQAVIDSGDLTSPLTPGSDVVGPYSGTGNDNEWGELHAGILQRVMAAELAIIDREYDRACGLALPGGIKAYGTSVAQWRSGGATRYRIVGILWGGHRITDRLALRVNPGETYFPIKICPRMVRNQPWTLWSHVWDPPAPGRYKMRARIDDRTIPTLRLDQGWYDRVVEISEV